MIYQWITRNREHIAKHGVQPHEAQYVVEHARSPFPREIETDKLLVWGRAESGRYLQVIFVYLSDEEVDFGELSPLDRLRFERGEEVAMVIHARDMTQDQKRQFRRRTR